ncbi:MAG TPA: hypothetical protein VMG13_04020 [Trebonia sp.]|nr:hypothetical protein [Trebonia sp.]
MSACTAYAYRAIQRHEVVTAVPAACGGLSRAQVNQAASTAIRQAAGSGPKSTSRTQAASAEPWVTVLLTGPVPASGRPPPATSPRGGPGSLLSPGSELAVKIAALAAWLITAASGGYVVVHWLRVGGRLRRRADTAVPPVVVLGHAGLGLVGLVLWTVFAATGWVAVAWVAAGLLAPVAGLGMSVLVIGLPSPRSAGEATPAPAEPVPAGTTGTSVLAAPPAMAAPAPARPGGRQPVLVIALHGLFAATVLALVLTAAVGAG